MLNLNWIKCTNNQWCDFLNLDLDHSHFDNLEGVYIIWHGGVNPWVVRVGQGIIGDRLKNHREDTKILKYKNLRLYVIWARINNSKQRDGIEKYLAEKWQPMVGTKFPDVLPIIVNSPWE